MDIKDIKSHEIDFKAQDRILNEPGLTTRCEVKDPNDIWPLHACYIMYEGVDIVKM